MNKTRSILVTGADGQVGNELRQLRSLPGYNFIFGNRQQLPIDDENLLESVFAKHRPDYCINCAGYTAVDQAEKEKAQAFLVNSRGAGHLSALSSKFNTAFVHISTDYVFDGKASIPYRETDATNPINAYGESKLEGEMEVITRNPGAIIIRTSWIYSSFGKNFVKTMLRLMSEKRSLSVVDDQIGAPTYAADLATAIMKIIESGKWVPGVFHFSNNGSISWFDFAVAIRDLAQLDCEIKPITTEQYPLPAKRPAFSVLDTTKIQQVYNIELADWKSSLKSCIDMIKG